MPPTMLAVNLLPSGTMSASSTASGYNVNSVVDGLEYTHWKASASGAQWVKVDLGSAQAAAALGIKKHNLKTCGATVLVESSDNGTDWTTRLTGFVPTSDKAILKTFASVSARYWQVSLAGCTAAPQMAVVFVGPRIDFPQMPESPFAPVEESPEGEMNRSKSGILLGVNVRWKSFRVRARFSDLARTWLDSNMQPWWDGYGSNLKPFFWAWDLAAYPNHVLYGSVPDGYSWRPDVRTLTYYESFGIEIEGAKE